jgi:hypothetical protein
MTAGRGGAIREAAAAGTSTPYSSARSLLWRQPPARGSGFATEGRVSPKRRSHADDVADSGEVAARFRNFSAAAQHIDIGSHRPSEAYLLRRGCLYLMAARPKPTRLRRMGPTFACDSAPPAYSRSHRRTADSRYISA